METIKRIPVYLIFLFIIPCLEAQASQNTGLFSFSNYTITVPAKDFSPKSSGEMFISLDFISTGNENLSELVNSVLYNGYSPDRYAARTFEDMAGLYREYLLETSEWLDIIESWEYTVTHKAAIMDPYAVITQTYNSYMGGAHGMYTVYHYVLDTSTPAFLHLNDIIIANRYSQLKSITEQKLRLFSEKITGLPLPANAPLSSGIYFEDDFEMNEFYPAEDGLHFTWNVYDIAAYVFGPVDIVIGWDELRGILTPRGISMAGVYRK